MRYTFRFIVVRDCIVLKEEHRAVHIDARLIGKIQLETRDHPKVIHGTVHTFQQALRTRSAGR